MTNKAKSQASFNSIPPLNIKRAIEEFEDIDCFKAIIKEFIEEVKSQIKIIRKALLDNHADIVRIEAHSIKGGAANLTADFMSHIALQLEDIGKSQILTDGEKVLKELEHESERLIDYAREKLGIDFSN